MYTIMDLLNKAVSMKANAHEIYKDISAAEDLEDNVRFAARIFANQENRNVQACKNLKTRVGKDELPSIDFDLYDKASNLISSFIYPDSSNIKNIEQLLTFAHDFQKQSISLMISIQGLLIRNEEDKTTITYKVLSEIIASEQKRLKNIENFMQ